MPEHSVSSDSHLKLVDELAFERSLVALSRAITAADRGQATPSDPVATPVRRPAKSASLRDP